jgi:hypothetical protein
LDEYPISTVHALAKAASINKVYDVLAMSSAVAAGAVHGVECGFGGKAPKALKRYQDGLLRQVRRQQSKGKGTAKDAQALFSGFGGAVPQEKRDGRRKDKSGGNP